jgi:excisionase family DNA binding protein
VHKEPANQRFTVAPRGLGIQAAAAYLGVTSSFIRSQIWAGHLRALMLGKRHIVDRLDLDRFLEERKGETV